ncbi:MAG: adenylyl-sulfate kinase [Thermodesulfobacteriota bacterium]|nr:adenylyl-sulfate kinase [Thermodesulfobacteriota bacterium]
MKKYVKHLKKENNLTWFNSYISREKREKLHRHKASVIWFTGFSASGKSCIAHQLEKQLYKMGCSTYVFDGDNVRHGLCGDLGFSADDRSENIRRIGEMVKLFIDAGIIAITAFISPYKKDRESVRKIVGKNRFIECYVKCRIEVCASRDKKGIYQKAQQGLIENFTGITAPYEPPDNPSLVIDSEHIQPIEAAEKLIEILREKKIII